MPGSLSFEMGALSGLRVAVMLKGEETDQVLSNRAGAPRQRSTRQQAALPVIIVIGTISGRASRCPGDWRGGRMFSRTTAFNQRVYLSDELWRLLTLGLSPGSIAY